MDHKINLLSARTVSWDSIMDKYELCNECDVDIITHACDKCGNGVCKQTDCSWQFPNKYNSNYILCHGCFADIDNKLINYDHMLVYKFLKNNMRKRRISC